ncbi:MAG: hypothetical protein WC208_11800 [Gallionella sp.]|jgi:putative oxidoreductase
MMKIDKSLYTVLAPRIQGILRIVIGFLFLQHGTAKLFAVPHIAMLN